VRASTNPLCLHSLSRESRQMSLGERAWWVPSENDSLVSAQDLRKARRMASRSRALAACHACSLLKRKCNDYRPCSRCLRQGEGDRCMEKNLLIQRMESPLPFSTSTFTFDQQSPRPDLKGLRNHWAMPCVIRLWSYGYRAEELKNFFDSMPDELCTLTQRALVAIARLSRCSSSSVCVHSYLSFSYSPLPSPLPSPPPGCPHGLPNLCGAVAPVSYIS
jgi:hypothetical protein